MLSVLSQFVNVSPVQNSVLVFGFGPREAGRRGTRCDSVREFPALAEATVGDE